MIYLNNAAGTYPKPEAVHRAVIEALASPPAEHGRDAAGTEPTIVERCRTAVARLFNAPSDECIVLTSGATEALNLALFGLELRDCHVITTVTEHNSVLRPLLHLAKTNNLSLTFVTCSPDGWIDPEQLEDAIRPETRAMVVNHCSNVTGLALSLETLAEIARRYNLVSVVDASQSAGVLPIDVSMAGIDILAFAGHKHLFGLPGTGGLYLRPELELTPFMHGGTGVFSQKLEQPAQRPHRYEAGTHNLPGLAALAAGAEFVASVGTEKIAVKHRELAEMLFAGLRTIGGIRIIGSTEDVARTATVNIVPAHTSVEEFGYMLSQCFDVTSRSGLHCAPLIHEYLGSAPAGTVRLSASWFTTSQEIDEAVEAIRRAVPVGASVCK